MGILDSLKSAAKAIFTPPPSKYKAPVTPRNSIAIEDIKNALPSAAAAATAPAIAASGIAATAGKAAAPIIGKAAAATGKSIAAAAAKNPLLAAGGGLVAFGALKENPKIATEGVPKLASGLVNVGENIGEFSKSPSVDTAKKIYKDNPLIAGGITLAGLGLIGGGVAKAASGLGTITAVNKLQNTVEDLKTGGFSPAPNYERVNSDNVPSADVPSKITQPSGGTLSALPQYTEGNTGLVSYETGTPAKRSISKRRKAKNIKTSSINIKNYNIMAVKNG